MTYMKSLLLGAIAGIAFCASASAADLRQRPSVYHPAPAPAASDWSGIYAGFNFGYGWGDAPVNYDLGQFFFPSGLTGLSSGLKPSGMLGGGTLGIQKQFGQWVFGLESDFNLANLTDTKTASGDLFGSGFVVLGINTKTNLDYVVTARGRIGYAFDQFMPYITGGWAWTRSNTDITANIGGFPVFNYSEKRTHDGWVLGGGIEGKTAIQGLTWKVEYLHMDFGSWNTALQVFGTPVNVSRELEVDVIRAGLNFKFYSL